MKNEPPKKPRRRYPNRWVDRGDFLHSFFSTRLTWKQCAHPDCPRPVGGHLVLAVDVSGNGYILRSPDCRNESEKAAPPNYGHSAAVSAQEHQEWREMADDLHLIWWAYLPDVAPPRIPHKQRYTDAELHQHRRWEIAVD